MRVSGLARDTALYWQVPAAACSARSAMRYALRSPLKKQPKSVKEVLATRARGVGRASKWKVTDNRVMKKDAPAASAVLATDVPTVLVIDDDQLTRGALTSLFRSIGLGVRTFASATELLEHPLPDVPSCLVLDVRLPRLSGFDLQKELSRLGTKIPIIFITGHGDIPMSVKAMKAGAVDFLTKPFRDQEMLDAVTAALERDAKRRKEDQSDLDIRARFETLTPRERQIMALVTAGLMNKVVAARIGISEMTVKIHRGHMMRKMGAKSLADLVLVAENLGIRWQEE